MATPDITDRSSVFAVNPALRQEYGPLLDYLAPKLSAYNTVFGVSEREAAILKQKALTAKSTPEEIHDTMRDMYPDRPLDSIFKTDNDLELLRQSLSHIEGTIQGGDVQPEVSTLRVGTEQAPVRVGFLMLPQKFEMVPETHVATVPLHKFAFTEDPSTEQQRRNDYKAFVVSHEIGHFVDEAEKGIATFDFDESKARNNSSQKGETTADRDAFTDMPDMIAKGLIKDAEMPAQIEAARKIETFHDLIQKGEKWTVGPDGLQPGKVVQDKNLDTHGTGFSIHTHDSIDEQNERMTGIGREIADVRNATLKNMLEEARDGKSTPEANAAYNQIVVRSRADSGFIERFVRKPVDAEEGERLAFNKMMTRSPDRMRQMADDMQKMPSVSEGARSVAGDYAAAYDYLVKGKKPDAAPDATAASSSPPSSAGPASTSSSSAVKASEPAAVTSPAVVKPPVQAPGGM